MPVILMYNLLSSFSSSELNIPRLLENPPTRLAVLEPLYLNVSHAHLMLATKLQHSKETTMKRKTSKRRELRSPQEEEIKSQFSLRIRIRGGLFTAFFSVSSRMS